MKKWMASLILVVFLFPCGGFAGEKGLKPQTVCPVLGGKINKDVYTDYQGQRIYFCCPACIKSFEKYLKKLE